MQVSSHDLRRLREHLQSSGFGDFMTEAVFVSTLFEIAFIERRDGIRGRPLSGARGHAA